MGDVLEMAIVECQHDLAKNDSGFLLRKEPLFDDLVEEFATSTQPASPDSYSVTM